MEERSPAVEWGLLAALSLHQHTGAHHTRQGFLFWSNSELVR